MRGPVKDTRLTVRLPRDLKTMTEAAAAYESRTTADIVRLALKTYFTKQGYLDPSFIAELATKEDTP